MRIWSALVSILGFWLCSSLSIASGFMDKSDFDRDIRPFCYAHDETQLNVEYPHGQKSPIPNSLEAFISLVEKLEHLPQKFKLPEVVKLLLVNFRYDDLLYERKTLSFSSRTPAAYIAFNILKKIFDNPARSSSNLPKEALTQDERCALYYMISHTVNGTIRPEDDTFRDPVILKHPREQGVVMLKSDPKHPLAIGKVLLGIFAGLANKEVDSSSIYNALESNEPQNPKRLEGDKIDGLYAATFGDLIAISRDLMNEQEPNSNTRIFLPNGEWDDETCPIDYGLVSKDGPDDRLNYLTHATYSSIRGAVDGYILGKMTKQIQSQIQNIRLSQMLRAYYSVRGLTITEGGMSWCFREQEFKEMVAQLQPLAFTYQKLYSAINGKLDEPLNNMETGVQDVLTNINSLKDPIFTDAFQAAGECTGGTYVTSECDTPRDMFAIMDYKSGTVEQREMQAQIVGNLSFGPEMSLHGSSVSVYTNLKPYSGVGLDTLVNGSTYSGCAGCAIKYNTLRSSGSKNEAEVFRDLNRMLEDLSAEEEDNTGVQGGEEKSSGVPAKVVLYFNYGGTSNDDSQTRNAVYDFERDHRDTKVLAFGPKKDNLRPFVDDSDNAIEIQSLNEIVHKAIKTKICKIPALFQYKNCKKIADADERANKYEGFISQNSIQYWAMYPEYFLKSYKIKLTFKALQGSLKVCFSRYYSDIFDQKEPKGVCRDTSVASSGTEENTVEFTERNPCHKFTVHNCRPFYFYIEAKSNSKYTSTNAYCTDERCKTPDQFPFEFTHEGVQCSKGSFLSCAAPTVFYAMLVAVFWLFSTAKGH